MNKYYNYVLSLKVSEIGAWNGDLRGLGLNL